MLNKGRPFDKCQLPCKLGCVSTAQIQPASAKADKSCFYWELMQRMRSSLKQFRDVIAWWGVGGQHLLVPYSGRQTMLWTSAAGFSGWFCLQCSHCNHAPWEGLLLGDPHEHEHSGREIGSGEGTATATLPKGRERNKGWASSQRQLVYWKDQWEMTKVFSCSRFPTDSNRRAQMASWKSPPPFLLKALSEISGDWRFYAELRVTK